MVPSPLPLIFTGLLFLVPALFLLKGLKPFLRAAAVSASIVTLLFLRIYVPGCVLMYNAHRGDPAAMYNFARWIENHDEQLGDFILWPVAPDVLGGYAWLEKAADMDYPPAVYAVGVRLKYGEHVPRPPNWTGADGNVFPQPERGQPLIDKALGLGYQPQMPEKDFYWHQYRDRWSSP